MPEEEKKKHPHKFKAVTEELTSLQPSVAPTPEETTEKIEEKPESEQPKNSFIVQETDNIDLNSKAQERGAFLKIFFVTFLATLLAFLLAGGIYVYFTGTKTQDTKMVVAQTPVPTTIGLVNQTPVPTPAASVDLATYKVSVLNGNGGIGVATAGKAVVEKVGFKVSYIGNADNFNYTDTLIQFKTTVSSNAVTILKKSLDANYSTKIGDPLDPASTYDIVVTVGSK